MESLQEYPFPIMKTQPPTPISSPTHRPPLIKSYATIGLAAISSPSTSPIHTIVESPLLQFLRPLTSPIATGSVKPIPSPRPLDPQALTYVPANVVQPKKKEVVKPKEDVIPMIDSVVYGKSALFRVLDEWSSTVDLQEYILEGLKGKHFKVLRDTMLEARRMCDKDVLVIHHVLNEHYRTSVEPLRMNFDPTRLHSFRAVLTSLKLAITAFSAIKASYAQALLGLLEPHPEQSHRSEVEVEDILRQPASLGSAIYMEWDMFELDCAWDIAFEAFQEEVESTHALERLRSICVGESCRTTSIGGRVQSRRDSEGSCSRSSGSSLCSEVSPVWSLTPA